MTKIVLVFGIVGAMLLTSIYVNAQTESENRAPLVSRTKTLVLGQATQLLVQIINPPTAETFHPKGRSRVVAHIRVRANHLHNPADVQVKHPVGEAAYSAPLPSGI
jgi:hypothetical protein